MNEQRPSKELFYLQARGHTGNSLLWWREGRHGYTNDIRKAHVFTKDEAFAQHRCRPDTDFPWRKDYIDSRVQLHVVGDDIGHEEEQAFERPADDPAAGPVACEYDHEAMAAARRNYCHECGEALTSDRPAPPPAASRCLGAECHHTLCGTGANSTAPRWPLVEALREIAGYQGTLDTNAELMRKCAQETLDEYFVEYAEEILSEPPQPVTRAIVDLVTELRDAAQIAADGDTYTGSGIAAAKELIARADAFLRTAVTKSAACTCPGTFPPDPGCHYSNCPAGETSASRCIKCGSSPLATERGRCEDCGARQSTESEG